MFCVSMPFLGRLLCFSFICCLEFIGVFPGGVGGWEGGRMQAWERGKFVLDPSWCTLKCLLSFI